MKRRRLEINSFGIRLLVTSETAPPPYYAPRVSLKQSSNPESQSQPIKNVTCSIYVPPPMSSESSGTAFHPHKEVRLDVPPRNSSDSNAVESEKKTSHDKKKSKVTFNPQAWKWPAILSWVPEQLTWQGLKPVIRCSIASWIVSSFS